MRNSKVKKIALCALLIALAMILSYVETLIPFPFMIPGMKLGLANIVTIVALYKVGTADAVLISILRILLSALLFGNIFSLAYSFAGGILSLIIMIILKRSGKFGITGVSIAGGICHNIAQIGIAAVLLETAEFIYYLPLLLISGTISGCLIGMVGGIVVSRIHFITK